MNPEACFKTIISHLVAEGERTVRIDLTTWPCGSPPSSGQRQRYPGRFLYFLKKYYPSDGKRVLHMFSGSMPAEWGDTTDIREETGAMIVAPYDKLPLLNGTYDMVIADPPYANHYANEWHEDLPKPKRILHEAARVTKPGGLILLLHIIIVPAYKTAHVRRVALHPILTGPNNAIRVLNVFQRI